MLGYYYAIAETTENSAILSMDVRASRMTGGLVGPLRD